MPGFARTNTTKCQNGTRSGNSDSKLRSLFIRNYWVASYSMKSAGLKMSTSPKRFSTSKSLSPVIMQSQLPATAVARTVSSSRSRQTGVGSSTGLTTLILDDSNAVATPASSGVNLNLLVSVSRNLVRMKSEVSSVCRRTQCSSKSLHTPRAIKAAISTLVSRTTLTRRGRRHPGRYRCRVLVP